MIFLRTYPVKFQRQKISGKYIVDFYCAKARLIIELDGSHHFEKNTKEKDFEQTKYLEQYVLTVIRIPNNQINRNFKGVREYIDATVKSRNISTFD